METNDLKAGLWMHARKGLYDGLRVTTTIVTVTTAVLGLLWVADKLSGPTVVDSCTCDNVDFEN